MFQIQTDIQKTHLSLHILVLTIELDYPEKFLHVIILLILDYHREIINQNCFD